jgi:putative drug exporter of the RND superfamily
MCRTAATSGRTRSCLRWGLMAVGLARAPAEGLAAERPPPEPLLARTTRWALRFRRAVLVAWLVILIGGGFASTRLSPLLSNNFGVPGTDSARAATILDRHFGERSDGEYLLVFATRRTLDPPLRAQLQAAIDRAAFRLPTARPGPVQPAGRHVLYDTVVTRLDLARAKADSAVLRRALRPPPGVHAYVSGQAAIQHDLDPVFRSDLRHGEFAIALPAASIVLLFVLGLSAIVTLPLLFAAATIATTLGLVFAVAHAAVMATYVTNLVELIGLALAVDYSLLVAYRFRDELEHNGDVQDAVVRTMTTAGRSVVFSGATVAVGLALLVFIPVPFVRSLGIGGLLIPLVSVAAATTLLPALLSLYGRRGSARIRLSRRKRSTFGFWHLLAHSIMRRPLRFLAGGSAVLLLAAAPAVALRLTPGSADGIPHALPSVHGFDLLRGALGAGALSPTQLVIDSGRPEGETTPPVHAAVARLTTRLRADGEVAALHPLLEPTHRYEELVVIGRHEYGRQPAQRFVERLRTTIVPSSRFPHGTQVLVGGGPAQGVDFLQRSYHLFPWLVLAVLALTYPLLLRAFRSLLLPLKAMLLNLLSVSASYGTLVVFFRFGLGARTLGLYRFDQIEGWIPIFLFALLFGLSMDYEVFLVTRMREAWDAGLDNTHAVADGLERTGRIVTAAAIIMVAAFSGFVAGRIAGLQEFGLGLAVAILLDATIVRALLVPSLMAVLGRWNWWLPAPVARIVRVEPSPLTRRPERSC